MIIIFWLKKLLELSAKYIFLLAAKLIDTIIKAINQYI